jgi:hypothetical protein
LLLNLKIYLETIKFMKMYSGKVFLQTMPN